VKCCGGSVVNFVFKTNETFRFLQKGGVCDAWSIVRSVLKIADIYRMFWHVLFDRVSPLGYRVRLLYNDDIFVDVMRFILLSPLSHDLVELDRHVMIEINFYLNLSRYENLFSYIPASISLLLLT
jgi:hypothetical protein